MISKNEHPEAVHHQMENSEYYLSGLRNGDKKVIETIYSEYSEMIIRMVQNNNGTVDEAKDVFQDVLFSIFSQAQSGLTIKCNFSSFLIVACKRRWLNVLSSKYHKNTTKFDHVESTLKLVNEDVDVFFENEDRLKVVKSALSMMDKTCKEIIETSWQTDNEGKYLGWMDVATILNMSYGYIRKKASECKSRLIEIVQKDPRFKDLKYGN
ncbi:MAG: sigma-70 family RNA polymerase sigma factor [Saprospiraceae bacterium]